MKDFSSLSKNALPLSSRSFNEVDSKAYCLFLKVALILYKNLDFQKIFLKHQLTLQC